jgi:hypothetical protein
MKTTMPTRPIANPRRTKLAHLKDTEQPQIPPAQDQIPAQAQDQASAPEQPQQCPLPQQTANPRRTVLNELPGA